MFVNHTHRLLRTGMSKWARRVPEYAQCVGEYTGFPSFNVFGFLDGTSRNIGRPGFWQRAFYSGHKRKHCLQFLSVTAPDGMILFTHGPTNGSHQDNWLVNNCKLNEQLQHLNQRVARSPSTGIPSSRKRCTSEKPCLGTNARSNKRYSTRP